jgi:hypothetical protein
MIKQRIIALTLIIFALAIHYTAQAQTYAIESLEGLNTKITLSEQSVGKVLNIYCLKDTIHLGNYAYIREVKVLGKKMLQVTYGIMAGSDISAANLLLLCVSNGKLCQALHVESFLKSSLKAIDSDTNAILFDEHQFRRLTMHLTGTDKSNYKLSVNIHDEEKSKAHPKSSHNTNTRVILNFDADEHIFYSTHMQVSKYFKVFDTKTQKETKRYIKGNFPVIKLNADTYYFIKGEWYGWGSKNNLVKYAYK